MRLLDTADSTPIEGVATYEVRLVGDAVDVEI